MGGYSMSAFQATSGFLNNEASTLISAVAGDALVGGFSIFIPSGPSDNFVFAIGKVSSTNGMQRHYATGSTSINVASDSGTLNPNGLPVLNPGSGTSSGSGSAPKPSPSPAAINPNPKPAQPTTRPASKCALKIGKTTTTFSSCAKMRDGTAYFSLSGNTLSVGFKSTGTSGWAALAFGRNMIGANAVFAQAPSGASVKPYTAQMNGFTPSSFSSPGNGGFSKVKVGRSGKKLAATFTMPWPSGTSSVPLMLGKGSMSGSNMMVHRGIPKKYNLQKSTLSLTK